MRDKSLNIWLIVLFGISGITALLLTWLGTMSDADKVLATLLGSVGLLVALMRALMLKSSRGRMDDEPALVEVDIRDKS